MELSSPLNERRFVKRKDTLEVVLTNEQTFYTVDLLIGQSKQNVSVVIDTGSSDLWVVAASNSYCENIESDPRNTSTLLTPPLLTPHTYQTSIPTSSQPPSFSAPTSSAAPSLDCGTYGVYRYDPTSFKSNFTEFLTQYTDFTFAHGQYGYDDVTVAGTTVRDLSFAVANETNSSLGVLGIGPAGSEASYSGELSMTNRYMYENLPMKMVSQGLIQKNAYSLFLNSSDASKGTVLFGGVDHAKYTGTLQTVKVVNRYRGFGYLNPISLDITLSGVSYEPLGSSDLLTSSIYTALFDSGTTSVYAPSDVIASIASRIGATYSESIRAYLVDCSGFENQFLGFDFTGAKIKVPLQDLLVTVASVAENSGNCALGIFPGTGPHFILGSSFLRSVYSVFDLDELEISMAQSNKTESSRIEVISSSIPSAVRAPQFSATFTGSSSSTSGCATGRVRFTWGVVVFVSVLLLEVF